MDGIATIDGQAGFAYSGSRPWHRLGTLIPGLMTVEESLKAGRADWEVTKEPIMLADLNMTPIEDNFATVRNGPETNDDGTLKKFPLGVVGTKYTVVQNHEAFEFFNNAISEKAACIETVGVLGNGGTVFAMARVPKMMEPVKGDPVEMYILLTTTHDGSGAIKATFTNVRVVCQNTLNAALKGSRNVVSIKHTKSAKARLDQAHKVLAASDKYWERLAQAYKSLAMQDMTRLDVIEFIAQVFPGTTKKVIKDGVTKEVEEVSTRTQNNRNKVLELFDGDAKGSSFAPGTKWQAYNALTEYLDWERSIRKNSDRWESSVFGTQAQSARDKALNLLLV